MTDHENEVGTFARSLASHVMLEMGFREPERHPRWSEICEFAQSVVDEHMESAVNLGCCFYDVRKIENVQLE